MPQYQGVWTLEQQAQAQSNQQWVTDPNFKNTTLLLQADGTGSGSQNQTFLDGSTNNFFITRNGNTTQGSFSPFSQAPGYWSNYFNGGSTISAASNSALNILAYDTFECWVNMSVLGTNDLVAGRDGNYWLGYNHTSIGGVANKFVFSIWNGSAWQAVSSTTSPVVGTWYHIVGVKDNTTLRFYVNGVQESTSTFSGSPVTTGVFYVASNNNTENLEGYVSNLRLITGASNAVFPYSGLTTGASFTPPTSPLTAVSSTQLLTCQSNRFVDNSTNAFTLTTVSVPSVQAFGPFAPALQWTPDVVGGSGYFDGTADYLATATSSNFVTSGDFTIEAWAYNTGRTNNYQGIVSQRSSSGGPAINTNNSGVIEFQFGGTIIASVTMPVNQWFHVAMSRSGSGANNVSVYLNGTRLAQASITTSTTTNQVVVGRYYTDTDLYYWLGYIASSRYTTSSIYSGATITVPTAPVTAVANTQLLLNYTNAGIYDGKMGCVAETVSTAQVSTNPVKYGTGSIKFNGSTDRLTIKRSDLFDFGTGDFTIESWILFNSVSTIQAFATNYLNSSTGWGWQWRSDTGAWNFGYGDTGLISYTNTPIVGTWIHSAVCRSNNVLRMFVNGVLVSTVTNSTNMSGTTTDLTLGVNPFAGGVQYFNGYLDDFRITKGVGRYTANFTPPQQALPRQ
jgi:hypothetical protein